MTIFKILSRDILWYNLTNISKTFYYINETISFRVTAKQNKNDCIFLNFDHVNLTGESTNLFISWGAMVEWYLSKFRWNLFIDWMDLFLYCYCMLFLLWKYCCSITVFVVWQSINDHALFVPSNLVIDVEYLEIFIAKISVVLLVSEQLSSKKAKLSAENA